ncbi:MAG: DUF1499 domain-containing protein [Gammaproteobacteria bacterium]|nr:DUF1499 domain-containing protein [Gammaproteobacteria bacterium]
MIRKLVYAVAGIVLAALIAYLALSVYSRRAPPLGMIEGRLRPCPDRPNCVCSEAATANVEPLRFAGPAQPAWDQFAGIIAAAGGRIVELTPDYLHATFETTYMRFVDDFEARLDRAAGVIHVRSASRVGYNDRSFNRRRIEELRAQHRVATAQS